jgi:hypothetical protein
MISKLPRENGHGDFCFGRIIDLGNGKTTNEEHVADWGYRENNLLFVEKDGFKR